MADVALEYSEPLESEANSGVTEELPDEGLLEELPEQFRDSEVEIPTDSDSVEPSSEESGEELEEELDLDEEESDEEQAEEEVPKGSRAQQRIRKLANERKELQATVQQQQAQYQQQLQYAQQQVQQQAAMQAEQVRIQYEQQNRVLQEQLNLLQSKAAQEEEKNLSPMEQYERKILRQAEERAKAAFDSELGQIKQHLQSQQEAQQEAIHQQQKEQRYQHYTGLAAKLRNEQILNGMEQDDVGALGAATDEMLLVFSTAYGLEPEKAAPHFQRYLNRYVQADLKRRSKSGAKKVRKSQRVPAGSAPGRAAGGGQGMPSLESLRAANFNSHIDWIAAGEPPVKKV